MRVIRAGRPRRWEIFKECPNCGSVLKICEEDLREKDFSGEDVFRRFGNSPWPTRQYTATCILCQEEMDLLPGELPVDSSFATKIKSLPGVEA